MAPIQGDDGRSGIPLPPPGTYGVWGDAKSTYGVIGTSGGRAGVYGQSNMPPQTEFGDGGYGVQGMSTANEGVGVYGTGLYDQRGSGVQGQGYVGVVGTGGVIGVHGVGDDGIVGESESGYGIKGFGGNIGVYANNPRSRTAAYLATPGLAGDFYGSVFVHGDLTITGTLRKRVNLFMIDHPLDPENKDLSHASIESSELKNLYDGVVKLDQKGEAVVELPEWFGALNGDFRYQLTCLGQYAPVFVAQQIEKNRFRIAGGTPGLAVSWQVTGVRQDAWAKDNPLTPETDKPESERGGKKRERPAEEPRELPERLKRQRRKA